MLGKIEGADDHVCRDADGDGTDLVGEKTPRELAGLQELPRIRGHTSSSLKMPIIQRLLKPSHLPAVAKAAGTLLGLLALIIRGNSSPASRG